MSRAQGEPGSDANPFNMGYAGERVQRVLLHLGLHAERPNPSKEIRLHV
jgi:hypothetical protein